VSVRRIQTSGPELISSPWAFWLNESHLDLARQRTMRFRRADNKKFTLGSIIRTFKQPQIYFFASLYPASVLAQAGYQCESLDVTLIPFR
jgi:uncharacterized protein (DUF2132 family)